MSCGKFTVRSSVHMELIDISSMVQGILDANPIGTGYCFLFNPHTTAGLTINEGADPAVQRDIIAGLQQIVPLQFDYHHLEGNSPSHIMASLMGCSLTIAVADNRPVLGTWQRIFFCEFDGPRTRKVHYHLSTTPQP